MLRYFATGADRPLLQDTDKIRRPYKEHRWRITAFYLIPPGFLWLDAAALGLFGFSIGGLIVFLAGLTAIDILPIRAAGAVKGVIGLYSYLGAATQDWISGLMIEATKQVKDGVAYYDFTNVFMFWIGASIASILLAMIAWNAKASE